MNRKLIEEEVEKLLKSEYGYLSFDEVDNIYAEVFPRRQYFSQPEIYNEKVRARLMLSCLPTESMEEILGGVERQDPRSILLYGDCFMYGLKDCRQSMKKALNLYKQAAELNLPEAMVTMAVFCSQTVDIYTNRGLRESVCNPYMVPNLSTCMALGSKLDEMWRWLEKSAELGWFSFTLVSESIDATRTNSRALKPVIKNALIQLKLLE
jgi:TPR repeat protein